MSLSGTSNQAGIQIVYIRIKQDPPVKGLATPNHPHDEQAKKQIRQYPCRPTDLGPTSRSVYISSFINLYKSHCAALQFRSSTMNWLLIPFHELDTLTLTNSWQKLMPCTRSTNSDAEEVDVRTIGCHLNIFFSHSVTIAHTMDWNPENFSIQMVDPPRWTH